jgi:hypothetical protein
MQLKLFVTVTSNSGNQPVFLTYLLFVTEVSSYITKLNKYTHYILNIYLPSIAIKFILQYNTPINWHGYYVKILVFL